MKRAMMIANPVHAIPPHKGAAVEWWMLQTCRRLRNIEPHIVCIAEPGYDVEETCEGVRFHRIAIGRVYKRLFQKITRLDPYAYAHRVARRIRAHDPDIVHVHNAPALFHRLRGLARGSRARWLLHMHNEMPCAPLPAGDTLVTVSEYLAGWYRARQPHTAVRVLTNGVDLERYRPLDDPAEQARRRARFGLPTDRRLVLYVGRMSPEKGPLDLVNAFAALARERGDLCLVLVGELRAWRAGDGRAEYCERVRHACRALGAACRLVGGVAPDVIHDLYPCGDLLVVPSEFEEPFCMVAIEGMAAGVPVLATRRGGVPEYLVQDQTGFFIDDAKDPARFARQIGALLDAPQRLAAVRANARRRVEAHHGWETVCRQTEALYDALLARETT